MKKILPFISIALLLALLYFSDFNVVVESIAKANIIFLIFAAFISVFALLVKIMRWKVLVSRISFKDSVFSFLPALFIANLTPARIGEPVRSFFLKKITGHAVSYTIPRVIIERALDLLSLVILSIVGIFLFSFGLEYPTLSIVLLTAFIVLMILVLKSKRAISKVFGILFKLFSLHKTRKWKTRSEEITEKFHNGMHVQKRILLSAFLLSLIVWFLEGFAFYLVMISLNIELPPIFIVAVFAFSVLMGTVSFLPGGIGSTEFVFVLILSVHIATAQATAIVILGRFLTFWLTMFICGIFWRKV